MQDFVGGVLLNYTDGLAFFVRNLDFSSTYLILDINFEHGFALVDLPCKCLDRFVRVKVAAF